MVKQKIFSFCKNMKFLFLWFEQPTLHILPIKQIITFMILVLDILFAPVEVAWNLNFLNHLKQVKQYDLVFKEWLPKLYVYNMGLGNLRFIYRECYYVEKWRWHIVSMTLECTKFKCIIKRIVTFSSQSSYDVGKIKNVFL